MFIHSISGRIFTTSVFVVHIKDVISATFVLSLWKFPGHSSANLPLERLSRRKQIEKRIRVLGQEEEDTASERERKDFSMKLRLKR